MPLPRADVDDEPDNRLARSETARGAGPAGERGGGDQAEDLAPRPHARHALRERQIRPQSVKALAGIILNALPGTGAADQAHKRRQQDPVRRNVTIPATR